MIPRSCLTGALDGLSVAPRSPPRWIRGGLSVEIQSSRWLCVPGATVVFKTGMWCRTGTEGTPDGACSEM